MKTNEQEDPRVRRTRQLLLQALEELLTEKGFRRLTVQAIAERSGINRVTFYGHFPDKYALLEYWLREQFQQQVASTCPATCTLNASNLEALIVTMMKWFTQLHRRAKPDDRQLLPLFFTTMPQELSLLLLEWFRQTPTRELPPHVTPEVVVMVMSWTIFGTSFQWSDGVKILSPEELAKQVTVLLMASSPPNIVMPSDLV
jgi:AcrR family transcriptional regulator